MAYRYEENPINGEPELIIDGWENGIAESPTVGLQSVKNANIKYYPGSVYPNYARTLNSTTAGAYTFTANATTDAITPAAGATFNIYDAFTVTTTGTLPAGMTAGTIYYKINSSNQISATCPKNLAATPLDITDAGSGTHTMTFIAPSRPTYWTGDPRTNVYYILDDSGRVWESTGGTVYWSLLSGNTLGNGQGIAIYKNYLLVFRSTAIDYCGNGSVIEQTKWTNGWSPTGFATLTDANHMALWGMDDVLYFCNGSKITSIYEVSGKTFAPGDNSTYSYTDKALMLPTYETAVWLSELRQDLIVGAGKRLYPWDRVSSSYKIPVFIKENINKVINILNTLYVTAGVKGNIYYSNGYQISFFKKIPDSFFGCIDPQLSWGDIMYHRNRLYVGVSRVDVTNKIGGVFSIDLDTNTVNFENQNSFGETVTSGLNSTTNVLIDLDASVRDSYVSAWYNGTTGGMDKSTTIPYANYETAIETDLIPVGTFLNNKTYAQVEFKLLGKTNLTEAVRLSYRTSLTDAYTLIGSVATSGIISYPLTSGIADAQWLQFKIELAGSTSNENFIRLRDIRIR